MFAAQVAFKAPSSRISSEQERDSSGEKPQSLSRDIFHLSTNAALVGGCVKGPRGSARAYIKAKKKETKERARGAHGSLPEGVEAECHVLTSSGFRRSEG